jgi:5-methylcytosine-specific restriction endonuclease McrA
MSAPTTHYTHSRYRRLRKEILAANDTCWLCGHGGADTIDHVIPVSAGGQTKDPANMRPAHGTNGCPSCGRRCNQDRGNGPPPPAPHVEHSRDW